MLDNGCERPTRTTRRSRVQSSPTVPTIKKLPLRVDTRWRTTRSITPPPTPKKASWTVTDASSIVASVDDQNMDSQDHLQAEAEVDTIPRPSPDHMKEFVAGKVDYNLRKERRLGSGRFSDVYLAQALNADIDERMDDIDMSLSTPPLSPVSPRSSIDTPVRASFESIQTRSTSNKLFAVKVPADRAAIAVLKTEATILSYLSLKKDSRRYMVSFHGRDLRNNALIFEALPLTLDEYISTQLNTLTVHERAHSVTRIVPTLCHGLCKALTWLHRQQIVHGDIKPGNILLRYDDSASDKPIPLLADFSASFHIEGLGSTQQSATAGAGTYEFTAPELLKRANPAPQPSFASDIWALAMTALVVVIGQSPFTGAANRFMLLEMVKMGKPLEMARSELITTNRLDAALHSLSGNSFTRLLKSGFQQDPSKRSIPS